MQLLFVVLGAAAPWCAHGYLPVFMMHGVGSGASEMATIQRLAEAAHPGQVLTSLPLYEGHTDSLERLNAQAAGVAAAIRAAVAANASLYENGYHLVCKSQGGLICRAALMQMDDHKTDTFVSLAGPQVGVFGSAFFKSITSSPLLENLTAEEAYRVAYTLPAQLTLSVANMWRDPKHLGDYLSGNRFLPAITENAGAAGRANFVRLKKAVFCVGSGPSYDGGIEPWQSAVFGAAGADGVIRPMEDQDFYKSDTFGLRTLHESGRLNFTVVPNATHGSWTGDEAQITALVLPHIASYA